MTIVLYQNFLAYKDTTFSVWPRHSSSLSFVPQEMSLNIDMNRILPVKSFWCFLLICSGKSLTLPQSCKRCRILGRCFHSNSVGSPLDSVKVSVALRSCDPILSFSSKLRWHLDFDGSFQDTIQNLKRRRPSCVEG